MANRGKSGNNDKFSLLASKIIANSDGSHEIKRCLVDAFELWCWRRLLRVPWTARRSNQSILKEINPDYWPPDAQSQLIGKDSDAGKD